jgi:multidrug efflux pump subunit AcrA (membrane-fusion protein)
MPLMNVVNLDEIVINADVPERYVGSVTKGEEVTVSFPALGEERKATISAVGNIINPANRTFNVEIKLPNKDNALKANLLAVVKIIDYQNPDVITLPTKLIQHTNGEQFVFLAGRNSDRFVAKKTMVKTGATYEGTTEILSGIAPGDTVIDEGSHDVSEGSLLDIQDGAAGEPISSN